MQQRAEDVLGIEERRKNPWISDATFKLADDNAKAECDRNRSAECRKRYCDLCNATKRLEAYRLLKAVKAKQQRRISVIKDKEGRVVTDNEQVSERWAEYCEELYSDSQSQDESVIHELANISPPIAVNEPEILLSEVEWAIAKLRNNKGVGIDGIPA